MKRMLALLVVLVLLLCACTMPETKDTEETIMEEIVAEEPVAEEPADEEESVTPSAAQTNDAYVGIWSSVEGEMTDPAMLYETYFVGLFENGAAIRYGWRVMDLGFWTLTEDGNAEVVFDAGCARGQAGGWQERTEVQEETVLYVYESGVLKQPKAAQGDFGQMCYYAANDAHTFSRCADLFEVYHEKGMENWLTQYAMNMGSSRCASLWNGLEQLIFDHVLLQQPEEDAADLEESEASWKEAKEQQLQEIKAEYDGGTIAGLMISEEDREETMERAKTLLALLEQSAGADSIFAQLPEDFMFYSGAGGWATELTLSYDGSFTGRYYDYDLGDTGEEYPNGTGYICDFVGKFTEPEQISECWYMMELESIVQEKEAGQLFYEDGYRYLTSDPHGLEEPELFYLYLPGATADEVAPEFMNWYQMGDEPQLPEGCYGIYNHNAVCGFIARDK